MRYAIIITPLCLIFSLNALASPDSLFVRGNELYSRGQYDLAVEMYEQIIEEGYEAAELYFNLGNAYYKMNNIPQAILNYERAGLLDPRNEDIMFNLEKARTFVTDKIDVVPEFFVRRWIRYVYSLADSDWWAKASIVSFIILLGFLLAYLFTRNYRLKKISFWLSLLALFIAAISFVFSAKRKEYMENHPGAIIVTPTVTAKSSPNEYGTNLFILHEGAKVFVTDSVSGWNEIRLEDGNKGWIPGDDLVRISYQ